jgi:hypothetical protein
VEGNVTWEYSKELGRKKGDNREKGNKTNNEVDHVGPISPKCVRKLDKGKIIVLEEQPAPMVERSSKTKKIRPDLSTKRKTQISEKRRKKQRSDSDVEEIAGSVPRDDY